jgi:hypothetical protein
MIIFKIVYICLQSVHGGSAYGAGCIAGHGPTKPSALELELAETQG